jgi:leader peptidase (prepilin peptidase)/N-methyltransferase
VNPALIASLAPGGGFAGFLLGGLFAGALLVGRRADRKHSIPFGPFMIAGAVLALVVWPR